MNRRPIVWLAAAIAVVLAGLLAWWASNAFERVETTVVTPPRGEAARDPLYAARRLVATLGGTAVAADGFQRLPPPGAVLVLASPHANLFPGGIAGLLDWVRRGGRLVLDLGAWQNAELAVTLPLERAGDDAVPQLQGLPRRLREMMAGTARCQAFDEPANVPAAFGDEQRRYTWCGEPLDAIETDAPLAWALAQGMALRVARIPLGQGSVTLTALAHPFDRAAVLEKENALAFAATLDLRPRDTVWFIGDNERASLLALLWQHGWPAIVLLATAIALALWREAVRFGPVLAAPSRARRSVGEQVRRTAAFIAGRGGGAALHAAAVRALDERARRVVAGWRDDEMIPERAARIAAHAQAEAALEAQAEAARAGRMPPSTGPAAVRVTLAVDGARLAAALRAANGSADRRTLADALATLEQARRALLPRRPH